MAFFAGDKEMRMAPFKKEMQIPAPHLLELWLVTTVTTRWVTFVQASRYILRRIQKFWFFLRFYLEMGAGHVLPEKIYVTLNSGNHIW